MEFKRLTLDCINNLKPYFANNQCRICDCTIGGTFIWRDYHKTEYAIEDGVLYFKVSYPEPAFTPPRSTEPNKGSYEQIIEYCCSEGVPAKLCAVSEPVLQVILEKFPDSKAWTDRTWSDYLYKSDDLRNLSGRKYAGQRNHINHFLREHQSWSYERITSDPSSLVKIEKFYEKYASEHKKETLAYTEGDRKAMEVLGNLDDYGLLGGALYVSGELVGVSIGEVVDDTLFIHIEKAETKFHGAYPMLVNQFAVMFATEGIEYINREEDDGDEGLRISKLSYHPTALLNKYAVELH